MLDKEYKDCMLTLEKSRVSKSITKLIEFLEEIKSDVGSLTSISELKDLNEIITLTSTELQSKYYAD